jgi:cell division protein FtsB
MESIPILISLVSTLLMMLIGVLCWIGKRTIAAIDKLNSNVARVVVRIENHEGRLTRLENPPCEH